MRDQPVRLMLIDDDEEDYILTRDLLADITDFRFELEWLADADRAVDVVCEGRHDLYLIDYTLGRCDGLTVIRESVQRGAGAPMILLTGVDERAVDLEAMRVGAADYLEKRRLSATLLERSIRYSLQQKRHAEELERRVQERTAELALANKALREVDARKNEYLSTLAHELRNPLVPIRNTLEIMRLAGNDPKVVESSRGVIERQVTHIVRLIDDLTVVARISRGVIQLKLGEVAVERVVDTAVESVRPFISKFHHDFAFALPPSPVVLRADADRLSQVLYNLLHNAAKYTHAGGRIRLEVSQDADGVSFRVEDDGPGIPEDMLEAVFDIFTQVKRDGDDGVASGLGVGLWLVRRLVELHGGRVHVQSGAGRAGSEFTVWIPMKQPVPA